jgi:enoyl-[acyl-carrier protein] reductase II
MEAAVALSGQVAGRIDEIKPVAQIIEECARDCLATIDSLAARYPGPT